MEKAVNVGEFHLIFARIGSSRQPKIPDGVIFIKVEEGAVLDSVGVIGACGVEKGEVPGFPPQVPYLVNKHIGSYEEASAGLAAAKHIYDNDALCRKPALGRNSEASKVIVKDHLPFSFWHTCAAPRRWQIDILLGTGLSSPQ